MSHPPSKYDGLDASRELEQEVAADLEAAFGSRGCEVIHHGTKTSAARGGRADIELRDPASKRLILVEVTKETGHAAGREFPAVTAHLEDAVKRGGYGDYWLLYVSPKTSPRMRLQFNDLYNAS